MLGMRTILQANMIEAAWSSEFNIPITHQTAILRNNFSLDIKDSN